MNAASAGGRDGGVFVPLLDIELEARLFASNWLHCDRLSSYVARMVGHNRSDPFVFSNLLSSALNELLETVFRTHDAAGKIRFRVMRLGPVERIEILVPCGDDERQFYMKSVEDVRRPDASETYLNALFSEGPLDRRIGLLELAVDYEARFAVERENGAVRLTVDLALEERTDPC